MSELFQTSSAGTTLAPAASYSASLKYDEMPAPSSIRTLNPGLTSLATLYVYGESVGKQQKEVSTQFRAHKDTELRVNQILDETCQRPRNIKRLTSGVAATRFSSGKVSLGTPTVSLE